MRKLYIGQGVLSIVPFYSSILVLAVSIVELRKYKASGALWLRFILTFLAGLALAAIMCFAVLGGANIRAKVFCAWLILAAGNILCVLIQKKAAEAAGADMNSRVPIYFIPLFFGSLLFASSAIPFVVNTAEIVEEAVNIEDTNGVYDTHVALIEEESISSEESWNISQRLRSSSKGGSTDVESELSEYDRDESFVSAGRMSGLMTLQATKTDKDTMRLHFDSSIGSGNMEMYVVIDGEIFNSVPTGRAVTVKLEDISGKLVVVRIAAESATFEASVVREIG